MKRNKPDLQAELNLLKGKDALDQSIALNRIVMTLLEQNKRRDRIISILLAISIVINALIVGGFLWYESQFETTWETTTTTTTITQDSENGNGNNVYQSGDSAKYVQGDVIEEDADGETDNCDNYYNEDKDS